MKPGYPKVVPPADRPLIRRTGVRILVVADDEVLLIQDRDLGVPGSSWWATPGGGVDPGESFLSAAVRELWEETGIEAVESQLVGPAYRRLVAHGYSDRVLCQAEEFFVLRTTRVMPQPQGLTDSEIAKRIEARWWPLSDLPPQVRPAKLVEILAGGLGAGQPELELGECVVELTPEQLAQVNDVFSAFLASSR